MADPTGNRPVPTIATGESPTFDTDKAGGTDKSRKSSTGDPTGSRPVPGIPHDDPPHAVVPGDVKKPIKHTTMSTPTTDRLTGATKKEGGGTY